MHLFVNNWILDTLYLEHRHDCNGQYDTSHLPNTQKEKIFCCKWMQSLRRHESEVYGQVHEWSQSLHQRETTFFPSGMKQRRCRKPGHEKTLYNTEKTRGEGGKKSNGASMRKCASKCVCQESRPATLPCLPVSQSVSLPDCVHSSVKASKNDGRRWEKREEELSVSPGWAGSWWEQEKRRLAARSHALFRHHSDGARPLGQNTTWVQINTHGFCTCEYLTRTSIWWRLASSNKSYAKTSFNVRDAIGSGVTLTYFHFDLTRTICWHHLG